MTSADGQDVRWVGRSFYDGHETALDDRGTGCPQAAAAGIGAPVVPTRLGPRPEPPGPPRPGRGAMWRWAEHLVPVGEAASLGEGGTPLMALPDPLAAGLAGRVLVKDERANPTGSFKDRLAAAVVSRARYLGATTVAAASSGNAGLAVAAQAAAAGLDCVVLTTGVPPAPTASELAATRARLLTFREPGDRWTALRTGADVLGWFPATNHADPPVSSHPAGVHAYRTIAYEIAETLGWAAPDHVVLPVSRGDGLFGVWAGFAELAALGVTTTVPRMVAVERHPSLTAALRDGAAAPGWAGGDGDLAASARAGNGDLSWVSRSIGDRRGTYMALETLRRSGGSAVAVDDTEMLRSAGDLAAAGLVLETSSAAVLPGIRRLADEGWLDSTTTTVVVATAGARAQATVPDPPDPGPPLTDPADPAELAARAGPARASPTRSDSPPTR